MIRRKLLILLFGVALVAALVALPTGSASAEQRTLLVTLLGGQQITVTVDVPPGTPLDQIQIPGVNGVIVSVSEIGGPPAAPEAPATAPAETTPQATTPAETTPATPTTPTTPSTTPTTPSTTTPATSGDAKQPAGGDPARGPKAAKDDKSQRESQKTTTSDPKAQREDETKADAKSRKGRKKKGRNGMTDPRADGGEPTPANPTYTLAEPGPAPIGVPNFFIEKFRIPPFLLPIYQAAGIEYGVRWEVLAAINEIETDYGRNLNVSTAGAVGWMQFLPSTWKQYGVDANDDGRKDPYNPVDAIFGAARYLKAAGASGDLRKAIFAYNHADWYVDSVVLRARLLGGLPADFVGSLTGLTQGRFPVHARAAYADDISEREALRRVKRGQNAAVPVESQDNRRSIDIFAKAGSPVVAVQDGRIVAMGRSKRLGRYIRLRDAYGNVYTYANLKSLSTEYPVPKAPAAPSGAKAAKPEQDAASAKEPKDPVPTAPATAGRQTADAQRRGRTRLHANPTRPSAKKQTGATKARLFANPSRPNVLDAGGREQILDGGGALGGLTTVKGYVAGVYGLKSKDVVLKRLRVGSRVIGGTILGRVGRLADGRSPRVTFAIRPAGRGAPLIDPKPILDGWKLLESTAIYRAEGRNALTGSGDDPSVGQVLLMSKDELTRRVLTDPRVEIYDCGQSDIRSGAVDRRVLATLEFLSASGLRPTVTSMRCGHSYLTASGNVSEHSSGDAVDIAKINGIPILGHQGAGSITDITIRRLLTLQGVMEPHQIISLMTYPGADNTLSLPDHADHIHVGFRPLGIAASQKFDSVLKPGQWTRLIDRLNSLDNPTVSLQPSKYAVTVPASERATSAHDSE
ncbi:lytic murein transglycosylase [Capillimicrobium parvum]|uniref:Transglycosylase SLT domain-containing protein n=1 Tax=Capillimicrobium parvum TaxID=2884022 RepID=A0A9E7C208_9ACTN|nr:lytic murein transglycosylase [Capillimicrobium parvum]UGS37951.1 hypothetical protein DSM104329_04373 [Capillimicrobium parvum]